jgi:hypothetical protein
MCVAGAFGVWFALNQVRFVDANAPLSGYPALYFAITVLRCSLTIVTFFLLSHLVLHVLSQRRHSLKMTAVSFTPLLLVYAGVSMPWVVLFIAALQLCCLAMVLNAEDYRKLYHDYALCRGRISSHCIYHTAFLSDHTVFAAACMGFSAIPQRSVTHYRADI